MRGKTIIAASPNNVEIERIVVVKKSKRKSYLFSLSFVYDIIYKFKIRFS